MENKVKNAQNKYVKIWQTLVLQNCLPLGKQARFTSKNVAQYLLGSRNDYNLFKFNEIKHLLLKFTPLIETLFRSKLVLKAKVGQRHKKLTVKPTPPKDPKEYAAWSERMKDIKIIKKFDKYYYKTVENTRPVKILFASTNPIYKEIIEESALTCQMSAKTNRWLCGYITSNAQYLGEKRRMLRNIDNLSGSSKIEKQFEKVFTANHEAKEYRYQWHNLNSMTQRPALAIIPDIENNDMIIRETMIKDIPVIGLINSNEATKIAYPIFGNTTSVKTVHFFCHFLALLVAKAFIEQEYKQTSHRIFNRTRSIFANKKRKLKYSSVDAYSRANIIVHQQIYPTKLKKKSKKTLTQRANRKFRCKPKYPKSKSKRLRLKNFSKFLKFHLKQQPKKTQDQQTLRNLSSVGRTPYWKNINMMIITLRIFLKYSPSVKTSHNDLLAKAESKSPAQEVIKKNIKKAKASKNSLKIKKTLNDISSTDIANIYQVKTITRNLTKKQQIYKILLQKYINKLKKLKLLQVKPTKRLYLALDKNVTQLDKLRNKYQKPVTQIQKLYTRTNRKYKHLASRTNVRKVKLKKWKASKKFKMKLFIKSAGHKHMATKTRRQSIQNDLRHPEFDTYEINSSFRNAELLGLQRTNYPRYENDVNAQTFDVHRLGKLYHKLRKYPKERAKLNTIMNKMVLKINNLVDRKESNWVAEIQRVWQNKKYLSTMLKKYPLTTLAWKNITSSQRNSQFKLSEQILFSEWANKKKHAYKFNSNFATRKSSIANHLTWDHLYFKTWIERNHKKNFLQKTRSFWLKSRIASRGKIRIVAKNQPYYYKTSVQFQKVKKFPKFLTTYKHSRRNQENYLEKKNVKSLFYYKWRKRQNKILYWAANYVIPDLLTAYEIFDEDVQYKKKPNAKNKNKNKKTLTRKIKPNHQNKR